LRAAAIVHFEVDCNLGLFLRHKKALPIMLPAAQMSLDRGIARPPPLTIAVDRRQAR
jgi:hypothetical protein